MKTFIILLLSLFVLFVIFRIIKMFNAPKPPFGREAFLEDMTNAQNGNVHAMVNVGLAYWRGDGVEQNFEKAEYWLSLAVSKGNYSARYALKRLKSEPDRPIL